MKLYHDLTPWYHLVDPVADHADEAAAYQAALEKGAAFVPETLLELGAGAGNNAFFLKKRFRCTLTDLSEDMLALSRAQNPECEHVQGDMRTLRLGRQFDTVLVHDAVCYMLSEDDLRAAAETAFLHTRPGGAALFAPDNTRDQFHESSELLEAAADDQAMRGVAWSWDPDPDDDMCMTEYAFLFRQGTEVTAVHDRHVEGLFSRDTWRRVLEAAGFQVQRVARPIDEDDRDYEAEVFLCHRPEGK